MNQNKKINLTVGGAINSSFNGAIGGSIRKLDWLSKKEDSLKAKQTLISKFHADTGATTRLGNALKEQKARLSDLDTKYKESGATSQTLRLRIEKLNDGIDNTTNKLKLQNATVDKTKKDLKDAGIDTANLTNEEKRLQNSFAKTQSSMRMRSKGLRIIGSSARFLARGFLAVGTASIGVGLASMKLSNNLAQHGADVVDTAIKLGIGTTELQKLRYTAELSGVSISTLDKSIEKLSRNTVDASHGVGTAKKAFDTLGLSASELKELKPEQSLSLIADKLKNVTNKQERLRLTTLLFGRSGGSMVNMLKDGSAEMEIMGKKAEKTGYVLSTKTLKAADLNDDAYFEMQQSIKGVSYTLGNILMPTFTKTFGSITTWLSNNQERVKERGQTATVVFQIASSFLLNFGTAVSIVFSKAREFGNWLSSGTVGAEITKWGIIIASSLGGGLLVIASFSKGLLALGRMASASGLLLKGLTFAVKFLSVAMRMNPIGLIITGITAVLTAVVVFKDKIKSMFSAIPNIFKKAFKSLKSCVPEWIQNWFSGDTKHEIKIDKTNKFASMSDIAQKTREYRATQHTKKNSNVNLHNNITIQGNADKKHMEEAIRTATVPLYGQFGGYGI